MRRQNGFSLIELLVVIGILGVLVAILLPVMSKVRRAAYGASTAQSISTLQAAIQQYWSTFNAYPNNPGVSGSTSTEGLLLCLQGGLRITSTSPLVVVYDIADVGRGPVSFNPRNPKRYTSFGGVKQSDPGDMDQFSGDTVIPEFIDAFPESMPILYYGVMPNTGYSINEFAPYGWTEAKMTGFTQNTGTDGKSAEYFGDPSAKTGAAPSATWSRQRNADTYVLIAAGPDRIYGTKDDQTNFGTPGE